MDLLGRSGPVLHASRKDRLRKQPQFLATAVAEKLAAINTAAFFLERRERADFAAFRGEGWQDHLAARIFECGRRCAVSVDMNCSLQTLHFKAPQDTCSRRSYLTTSALTIATGNDKDFRRPGIKIFNTFEQRFYCCMCSW